jgi:probable HAF family extracellular repeat protein
VTGLAENTTHDPTCVPPQVLQFKPVLWEKGEAHELPTLPGDTTGEAQGINDHGQAVGASINDCTASVVHAVLWQNDTVTDLGGLGGTFSFADHINDRGLVVGGSNLPGDTTSHAFLWTRDAGMQDLGTLPGDFSSGANSINSRGQAVGLSCDMNDNCRAFLWQNGVMRDLNTLVGAGSPMFVFLAYDINSRGQIAGWGLTSTGDVHAFLATPCHQDGAETEGCENDAEGDIAAQSDTSESPKAALPENVRKLLRRRLGPFSHIPRPVIGSVSAPQTPIPHKSDWRLEDEIAIHDRAEFAADSGARPPSNAPANSCPAVRCSLHHTQGTVCGFRLCHIPGPVLPIWRAYDLTYQRVCFYGC